MTGAGGPVAGFIEEVVAEAYGREPLGMLILQLLRRPGRALASPRPPLLPGMLLTVCGALGGPARLATVAAGALEFSAAATDLVDDLIDGDWDETEAPSTRVLNASLAMGLLSQRALAHLDHRLPAGRALHLSRCLTDGLLDAAAGEDCDILFEHSPHVTEDESWAMAERKAGALVATACRMGAWIATENADLVDRLGAVGGHIGVVAQLLNDLAAVDPGTATRGTDLGRRKKTLPVAYALRCAREEGIDELLAWASGERLLTDEQLATHLWQLGAHHFTWAAADAERRRALDLLETLTGDIGAEAVAELTRLIPKVELR